VIPPRWEECVLFRVSHPSLTAVIAVQSQLSQRGEGEVGVREKILGKIKKIKRNLNTRLVIK